MSYFPLLLDLVDVRHNLCLVGEIALLERAGELDVAGDDPVAALLVDEAA